LKRTIFILLAVICGLIALYYSGMCVRSVDYHDGQYHPIPRERYALTMLAALVGTICFWKLAKRFGNPPGGAG
jgi:H+/Cl- antiporter ClcA